jgi:hypothetical protein
MHCNLSTVSRHKTEDLDCQVDSDGIQVLYYNYNTWPVVVHIKQLVLVRTVEHG